MGNCNNSWDWRRSAWQSCTLNPKKHGDSRLLTFIAHSLMTAAAAMCSTCNLLNSLNQWGHEMCSRDVALNNTHAGVFISLFQLQGIWKMWTCIWNCQVVTRFISHSKCKKICITGNYNFFNFCSDQNIVFKELRKVHFWFLIKMNNICHCTETLSLDWNFVFAFYAN